MKKLAILIILQLYSVSLFAKHVHLKNIRTKANSFAKAIDLINIEESIWPYSIKSIGHSMQSYQKYGFSSAYWHDGLDIRGEANEKVYASVSGRVVNIENYYPGEPLYWEVAILDDSGFVWKYHHIDSTSIPLEIKKAFKNGTRIKQGDYIGNIISWPVSSYGEKYNHIHLLIVDGKGRYVNPFKLLPKIEDTSVPTILKIGLFDSNRKIIQGDKVRGDHGVYIQASDTVMHDKFILTPYFISYSLDHGAETPVWKFDYLPSVDNDQDYINDFYLKGTCGDYRCREFYINLNFNKKYTKATKFFKLNAGKHNITVFVKDFAGNSFSKTFSYTVSN